ncbi:MAG: hypothetical protein MJZ34_15860 [Paludibacteraceae bacterium]|nr:hypothetical protein [Paludibacteraceae bacterium]
MKYRYLLIMFLIACHGCGYSQVSSKPKDTTYYYPDIVSYFEHLPDLISLSSIIEVNGVVHPRDTYGYIDFVNNEGFDKRYFFWYLNGIICISKKEYDEISTLPDSSHVIISLCLQSPVNGDWGGYWEQVVVKGSFESRMLKKTVDMSTPCFHFIIISLGKELFKIDLDSWGTQACYYTVNATQIKDWQKKRLDRKECRLYKWAKYLNFERPIW